LLVVHLLLLLHLVILGLEAITHLVLWLLHSHVRLKSLLVEARLATELLLLLLGLLLIHIHLGLEALHGLLLLLLHASKALVHHVLLSHWLLHGLE